MPFNGSGTFNRIANWTLNAAQGINILPGLMDTDTNDIAAGLSLCLTRDGQSVPTANISWNGQLLKSLGAPVDPGDATNKAYVVTAGEDRSMGGHLLTNVGTAASGTDAANKTLVVTATENRSMGGFVLGSVGAPGANGDAANKLYVDTGDTGVASAAAAALASEASTRLAADNLRGLIAGQAWTGNQDFTGANSTVATQASSDNSNKAASTSFVQSVAFNAALPNTAGVPTGYVPTWNGSIVVWGPGVAIQRSARTSNTILAGADRSALIDYTSGTFTQTLTAAATLLAGWFCWLRNSGTGVITVDPNGSETIGGAATATLNPGDLWLLQCDGANFSLMRLAGMNRQVFTSGSGNFTVPPGCYRLKYRLWGAGGGANASAGNAFAGAGGYSEGWMTVTPNATIAYAVGAAGTTSGTAGGATTFGSVSAGGGTGVNGSGNASSGNGSGGDFNMAGGLGFPAASLLIGATAPMGGPTGGFPGGGAAATSTTTAAGQGGLLIVEWE